MKKETKVTIADISRRMGVSRYAIYKWKTGLSNISVTNLEKMSKIYKISCDDALKLIRSL